jgi:hypothetical protein
MFKCKLKSATNILAKIRINAGRGNYFKNDFVIFNK